ncbi:MAG TPA: YkgJ family cysteine cluster protein [Pirellulaceae bacterium]|nr:YkgJ family cysteine cluster protein [Pirellulaceae bacterium]
MPLPIKTLPILEQWDCASCGNCCRGSVIPLSDDDLKRLQEQRWETHADFEAVQTVVRSGWFRKRTQLAQRSDGSCVFLTAENRCRIHAEHGADAKPLVCQMYPLQLVPREKRAVLTLRRSCPAAAADEGSQLQEHLGTVRRLAIQGGLLDKAIRAPSITRRYRGSWSEALIVARAIERLMTDERFPLVRRLTHGVRFCALLEQCKLKRFEESRLAELMEIIEDGCRREVGELFQERQAPRGPIATLFRQTAAEYLRLHSGYRVTDSWRERWRLARAAVSIARGRGAAPAIHALLPEVTFEALEQPLGHLSPEIQQPFVRLYEANACSLQYAIAARPAWSLVESFRAFALAYPVALWILRWCSHARSPTREEAIEMVTIMDRGQGHQPLAGPQHRRRVAMIARSGELERMIVWYSR